jgi:homoserine O-succinyltransferase
MALQLLNEFWREAPATDCTGSLVVGLVNNMPDAALRATEFQVRDLLTRAAGAQAVSLRIFSLPDVPRSEIGRLHVHQFHEPIANLWTSDIAGLIVTGTEPKAPCLENEPYWPALAQLIDWAEDHTISTIWSCLASHAAAWRLDRIERHSLGKKIFGVFECHRVTEHKLVKGLPRRLVPHSRYNGLAEDKLLSAGYQILSLSAQAGVDLFIRQRNSLFVFLQGHPEYDATALFGEYRRDVRRFLAGDSEGYPELPHGYFSDESKTALLEFRERAIAGRNSTLLENFPAETVGRHLTASWRDDATRLYTNWLGHLRMCKPGNRRICS